MLDRLERADLAAELHAFLDIIDGQLQHPAHAARLLRRQCGDAAIQRLGHQPASHCPLRPISAALGTRTSANATSACRRVWSKVGSPPRHTVGVAGNGEQADAVLAGSEPGTRAATISRSALCPSMTKRLAPFSI
jgi:hypothetical protein